VADAVETRMRTSVARGGVRWELERISDRPAMQDRKASVDLFGALQAVARKWEIPLERESSATPSVAGLVPETTPCLCGLGPVARDLGTPQESVQRISLVQRTLLLAQFLLERSRA
jgi:hypothetical protein